VPVVDFVSTDRRVAVGGYPDAREVVRVDLVVYKLTQTVLVNVNTSSLTVVDFALDHGRVGAGFHFETGDAVVVDVVGFEVTLQKVNCSGQIFKMK
jgi:hypothetical protein